MPLPKERANPPVNVTGLVRGLLPFLLLGVLLTAAVAKHMDWIWRSVAVASTMVVASTVWPWLKDGMAKQMSVAFHRFLTNPGVARVLWVAFVLAGLGSLFVSSVHANAEKPEPVWLFRMEEALSGPAIPRKVDSISLDRVTPHGGFVMMPPRNRRVWLLSSTYVRTPPLDIGPWSAPTLAYPERFDTVLTVALLPSPLLKSFIGTNRPLRVLIKNAGGDVIARDSLTNSQVVPSLLVSVVEAPTPDAKRHATWQDLILKLMPTASDSQRARSFNDWATAHRWIESQQPIMEGQKLLVQMVSGNDTVVHQTVNVKRGYTDAIISQRRP